MYHFRHPVHAQMNNYGDVIWKIFLFYKRIDKPIELLHIVTIEIYEWNTH